MYINAESSDSVGLFGYASGAVYDLNLESGYVKGKNSVGGFAGNSGGAYRIDSVSNGKHVSLFTNCVNKATVVGETYVGGILGYTGQGNFHYDIAGVIEKCRNEGNITGKSYVAGICGLAMEITGGDGMLTEILNCTNIGVITGDTNVNEIANKKLEIGGGSN